MKSFGNCTSPKPFERPEPISLGRTKYPFQIAMAGGSIFFSRPGHPPGAVAVARWRPHFGGILLEKISTTRLKSCNPTANGAIHDWTVTNSTENRRPPR